MIVSLHEIGIRMTDEPAQSEQEQQDQIARKDASAAIASPSQNTHLREIIMLFLRLGFTAFGGPAAHIALMREEVVHRRHWMSDEQFVDLIGITNLIPGPSSTQLAIYLGYLRAGWPGLILAGVCFIGPAMLIILAISWAYVTYGTLPQVGWLFFGIQPVVVAIIAQALWNLGRTILKGFWPLALAALILVLYLLGINVLLLLFAGALLFGLLRWIAGRRISPPTSMSLLLPFSWKGLRTTWHTVIVVVGIGTIAPAASISLLVLFLTFLKLGAVVYGSGYTLLAFLRPDLVQQLHWLTDK